MKWYHIVIVVIVFVLLWKGCKGCQTKAQLKDIEDRVKENISKIPTKHGSTADVKMNDLFDKIYLISLPKRREYALNALQSFHITPELIKPIWKGDLTHEEIVSKNIIAPNYDYKNMGRVACHLSHLKALVTFLRDPTAQTALIFEDDIKSCPNETIYNHRLMSLRDELKYVDGMWDILYIGSDSCTCTDMKSVTHQLYTDALPYQAHAYAVTRRGAQNILQETIPMYLSTGDHMYRDLSTNNKLKALTVFPPIFVQNRLELGSDLDNYQTLRECREFPGWDPSSLLSGLKLPTTNPLKFVDTPLVRPGTSIKYIHQSWKDVNIPQKFMGWVQSWKTQYPKSEYSLWTDEDNLNLVKLRYPELLEVYNSYNRHIKRCDAARYLYMYVYGGLYVDLDFLSIKSLEPLLQMVDHPIVFGEVKDDNDQVPNDIMYSRYPGHSFWKYCLDSLIANGATNKDPVQETGPRFLTLKISEWLSDHPNDILILKDTYLHPISSMDEECRMNGNGNFDENFQGCMEKYVKPETYAITFWAGSWTNQWSKLWPF